MPDIHNRARHRLAVQVGDLALQPHGFGLLTAVVHAGKALAQRGVGHVQWPFDGARGAHFFTGCGLFLISAHIQIVFQAQTGGQQRRFLASAQLVKVIHRDPELFVSNIELLDGLAHIAQQLMHDVFKTVVATGGI
ncbi:hypothetical protein D3C79_927320 [compost metagenome]